MANPGASFWNSAGHGFSMGQAFDKANRDAKARDREEAIRQAGIEAIRQQQAMPMGQMPSGGVQAVSDPTQQKREPLPMALGPNDNPNTTEPSIASRPSAAQSMPITGRSGRDSLDVENLANGSETTGSSAERNDPAPGADADQSGIDRQGAADATNALVQREGQQIANATPYTPPQSAPEQQGAPSMQTAEQPRTGQQFEQLSALNRQFMAMSKKAAQLGDTESAVKFHVQGMQLRHQIRKQSFDRARQVFSATGDTEAFVDAFNNTIGNGVQITSIEPVGSGGIQGYKMTGNNDSGNQFEQVLSGQEFQQFMQRMADPRAAQMLEIERHKQLIESQGKIAEQSHKGKVTQETNRLKLDQTGQNKTREQLLGDKLDRGQMERDQSLKIERDSFLHGLDQNLQSQKDVAALQRAQTMAAVPKFQIAQTDDGPALVDTRGNAPTRPVNGPDGKPIGRKLTQGQRKQIDGINNTSSAIDEYLSELDGWSKLDMINPTARARMGTKYNTMMLFAKEAFNLGVLNGPDYMILQEVVANPNNLKSIAYTKEALQQQGSELKRILNSLKSNLQTGTRYRTPTQADRKRYELSGQVGSGATGEWKPSADLVNRASRYLQ